MTVFAPDDPTLPSRLRAPGATLVATLCAEWCGTCREYLPKFTELAKKLPDCVFVWVDIEDAPELAGDEDIENFPTVLIQAEGGIAFFGPMLPHIGHLERLLETILQADAGEYRANGPDVRGMLLGSGRSDAASG